MVNKRSLKQLKHRIDRLSGTPVFIYVTDESGEEKEVLFSEWRESYPQNGLGFSRWSRGTNKSLKEFDFILLSMHDAAFSED